MVLDRREQAGLRERRWEVRVLRAAVIALQRVQRAAVIVQEIELAGVVFAEGGEADRRPRDLGHLLGAVALEAGRPQAARLPIAKDVRPEQLRELLAAIDVAAGDAAGDRVR